MSRPASRPPAWPAPAGGVDGPVESLASGLEAWDGLLEREDSNAAEADNSTAPF